MADNPKIEKSRSTSPIRSDVLLISNVSKDKNILLKGTKNEATSPLPQWDCILIDEKKSPVIR